MSNFQHLLDILQEDIEPLWEESNYRSKHTGLPVIIYVSVGENEGKQLYHSARIKVNNNYSERYTRNDILSFTIEDEPRIIGNSKLKSEDEKKIKSWIKMNKEILLQFWNFEIDDVDFVHQMKKYIDRKDSA